MKFLVLALLVIFISILLFVTFKKDNSKILTLIVGFFISGVLLFFQIYKSQKISMDFAIFYSIIKALQMFILNNNLEGVTDKLDISYSHYYLWLLGFLHIFSPLLLATAIISMISDKIRYLKCHLPFKDKYIFSEINKKSLCLALSIKEKNQKALIIFINSKDKNDNSQNLIEEIKNNRFIILNRAIDSIFKAKRTYDIKAENDSKNNIIKNKIHRSKIYYFNISKNQSSNIDNAFNLICKYSNNPNIFIYIFTFDVESELFIDEIKNNSQNQNIKLINETQTIAYELLKNNPIYNCINNENKNPNILLLGLGYRGIEILKALLWCGTSCNYNPNITIIDNKINERIGVLKKTCPALVLDDYRVYYQEENMDFNSNDLYEYLSNINEAIKIDERLKFNYIIVATGDDDLNIDIALNLKSLFNRYNKKPIINLIISDEEKYKLFQKHLNSNNNFYVFGCYMDIYKSDIIIDDNLDKISMVINQTYKDIYDFYGTTKNTNMNKEDLLKVWNSNNNTIEKQINENIISSWSKDNITKEWNILKSVLQRSNKALALHIQYRLWDQGYCYVKYNEDGREVNYLNEVLKINDENPGKPENSELVKYAQLEHKRWNTYMLTEGWVPLKEEEIKLDLKINENKQHACITSWEEISSLDKKYDKHYLELDMNFIKRTEDILNGYKNYNKDLDYRYKIIKINERK